MQYVNDDMDDIFRKAAEGYPLDTSGSDWNKVLSALQEAEEVKPAAKKNNRRRYLWLLMLLPLGLVCNHYYEEYRSSGQVSKETNKANEPDHSINTVEKVEKPGLGVPAVPLNQPNKSGDANQESSVSNSSNLKTSSVSNLNYTAGRSKKHTSGTGENPNSTYFSTQTNNPNEMSAMPEQQLNSGRTPTYTGFIQSGKLNRGINIHPSTHFNPVSGEVKKAELVRNPKRFYVGLMGGFDRTTVEFQKKSRTGFDYGVLFGYQLSNKWGVEVGAFMDKKYYYTDGQHFKNDNIYMPPNSWITDIYGDCRMWDLSLGGTYSLARTKKSGWFASAGISSYLMKEENYDYTYYYGTSGVSAVHSKTYINESKNLFSIVNLSLGYTHKMGKIVDLRVEPYMKLPIQGVGVGQLPLLSAGIHIGVTGKLF